MELQKKRAIQIGTTVLILAVGLVLLRDKSYILTLLNFVCMYIISVSGLDLLFGYSGQISLGHAAFYAIGAYTSALLSTKLGVPVSVSILAACVMSLVMGIIVALPASKLIRHFLSLMTIAVGQLVYILISRASFTNAMSGVRSIPDVTIFGYALDSNLKYLIFMLVMAGLALLVKQRIVDSRVGRAFMAIRENPVAANGIGINVQVYKITAFALSALFTGLAGALYGHFVGFISPETFTTTQSVLFMTMLLFGGMGTFAGPIIGAGVITILNELLQTLGAVRMTVYGLCILLVLLYLPRGIVGIIDVVKDAVKSKFAKKQEGTTC